MCLRTRTGGRGLCSAPGQSMTYGGVWASVMRPWGWALTGASVRGSLAPIAELSSSPLPHGRPPPLRPLRSGLAALTPLQPHGFPQRRHLLPLPADPPEVTAEGLRRGAGPRGAGRAKAGQYRERQGRGLGLARPLGCRYLPVDVEVGLLPRLPWPESSRIRTRKVEKSPIPASFPCRRFKPCSQLAIGSSLLTCPLSASVSPSL